MEIINKIARIDFKDILSEQMLYTEREMTIMKDKIIVWMTEKIRKKLEKKSKIDQSVINSSYHNFMLGIEIIIRDQISLLKFLYISDTFIDLALKGDEKEYNNFITTQVLIGKGDTFEYIDKYFIETKFFTKTEVQELYDYISEDIKEMGINVFFKVKEILIEKTKEKERLKKEMQDFILEKIGDTI